MYLESTMRMQLSQVFSRCPTARPSLSGIQRQQVESCVWFLLFWLLCLVCPAAALAQQQKARFERLSVEDGLSQSSGSAILQDVRGFMWFGTQDGLNKYDGLTFKIYRHDPSDSTTIASNYVLALHEEQSGAIWVALAGGGLDKFDPRTETFYHHGAKLDALLSGKTTMVQRIFEDHAGTLWFATLSGLARYQRAQDRFEMFSLDTAGGEGNRITALFEDSQEVLWVGTAGGEVFRLHREQGRFARHDVLNRGELNPGHISTVHADRFGLIWITTWDAGLLRYDPETGAVDRFQKDENDPASLSSNRISCIAEDQQANLWIGTEGSGLSYFDRTTEKFTRYKHDPYDSESLSNNHILSLLYDSSGTLWVGTGGGGINKYDPDRSKFAHFKNDLRHPDVLRGSFVWSLFEDSGGKLWIGTRTGGLNVLDRERGRFRVFMNDPRDPGSLAVNSVLAICEDLSGAIWVGTAGGGLNKLDQATGKFARFPGNRRNLPGLLSNRVRSLLLDQDGSIWMATQGGGLHRFDPGREVFVHFLHSPDNRRSISSNWTSALLQDRHGDLWIGTTNSGVNRFDKRNETFSRFGHVPGQAGSLSDNHVMALAEDSSGTIWVGTFYGLNRFDAARQTFSTYTTKDGLPNDVIYGILPDDSGHLWLSTNKGLSRFDPATENFRNFELDDGLQSYEFNAGASFKNRKGEMFFGGVNGFNVFHPDSIRDNPHRPAIVITAAKKFDQPLNIHVDGVEPLQLSYRDNFITFEFAALDYTNPTKNQYAYKLDGLHSEWIYCGTQRYATFTNLAPGPYVFRVKGANNDGVWNEDGAMLRFVVTPPFWKTWWVRWLSMAASLTALLLLVLHLKEREKKKAELNRKFSELKLQALRAQMNPHFIFNTLNSIQYYISNDEQKPAYRYLSKFSKLMRKILDNSEKSTLPIAQELEALKLYLDLEVLRFEGKFVYRLNIDPAIDVHNVEIPTLLIQPFVENAIQHGLRFKRTKGALDIRLQLHGDAVVCLIQDNGIGIEKALQLKSKHEDQHKSAGMKVTRERLATLNALRKNGRGVEIIDLSKESGGASGTRVKIVIPIE